MHTFTNRRHQKNLPLNSRVLKKTVRSINLLVIIAVRFRHRRAHVLYNELDFSLSSMGRYTPSV